MASGDWTELGGSLIAGTVARGVTAGIAPPAGGGSFLYGWNSLSASPGAHGLFCNLGSFAPMAKGGSVRAAVQRGISGGPLNFTPLLFIGAQGGNVGDLAYILGLQDDDPHRIVLRKGAINGGIPPGASGSGILRRSTSAYAPGTWLHLRLDMIVNLNGDVILQAFQNDLGAHVVTAPTWGNIPGLAEFRDDALGINSGSAPYTSGRIGFAFATKDVTRRGYIDQVECYRQL